MSIAKIGEYLFASRGVQVRSAEAGEVITRCREAVRVRYADGTTGLAFGGTVAEAERLAA